MDADDHSVAARRMGEFLTRGALQPSFDWESLGDQVQCRLTLLDFGSPERATAPTFDPVRAVHTTAPFSPRGLSRPGYRLEVCREMMLHLPQGENWGFTVRFDGLPSAIEEKSVALGRLLFGPFPVPDSYADLADLLKSFIGTLWQRLQHNVLTDEYLWLLSGSEGLGWGLGYIRAFIDKDISSGVSDHGSSLASDDAKLREGYLTLARKCRARGDYRRAAQYSLVAINTLQLGSETASGSQFTTVFPVFTLPGPDELVEPLQILLDALLEEFGEYRSEWRMLATRAANAIARVSRRAGEGVAVWGELWSLRLQEEGRITSLFENKLPSSSVMRQYYVSMGGTNDYRMGLEQAEMVERRLGGWFFQSEPITDAVLFWPLHMLAARVPVDAIEALNRKSLWAPNARLERLTSLDVREQELEALLTAVHRHLDADLPGIVEHARVCLTRAEQEVA